MQTSTRGSAAGRELPPSGVPSTHSPNRFSCSDNYTRNRIDCNQHGWLVQTASGRVRIVQTFFRHRGVALSLCAELLRQPRYTQYVSYAGAGVTRVIRTFAR
jgi:hypothetical protein